MIETWIWVLILAVLWTVVVIGLVISTRVTPRRPIPFPEKSTDDFRPLEQRVRAVENSLASMQGTLDGVRKQVDTIRSERIREIERIYRKLDAMQSAVDLHRIMNVKDDT